MCVNIGLVAALSWSNKLLEAIDYCAEDRKVNQKKSQTKDTNMAFQKFKAHKKKLI